MAEAILEGPGDGGTLENPLGGDVVYKVRGEQSGGALLAFETFVAPGEGPPLHLHPNEDETLYVLEGEVRFKLDGRLFAAPPGSFAFVPRGVQHTFQNVGQAPARILIHFAPAGMERFFDSFAALGGAGPDAFRTAAAEAGMEVVGPPLAQSDPL